MYHFALWLISVFGQYEYIQITPLSEIQVVQSSENSKFYIFSGKQTPQEYSPSMKIFDDLKSEFSLASIYPEDRSMYGMVIDSKGLNIYIYGGLGQKGVYGDL